MSTQIKNVGDLLAVISNLPEDLPIYIDDADEHYSLLECVSVDEDTLINSDEKSNKPLLSRGLLFSSSYSHVSCYVRKNNV